MRRLALLAAAILAVSAAPAARAEPLDVDLSRLGAPDPQIWTTLLGPSGVTPAQAAVLAADARQRFAILSTELALALSSAVLHPASTTGHTGFAVDLEFAAMPVHSDPVGVSTVSTPGFSKTVWPTNTQPSTLFMPSLHVRKALPYSLEFGGRLIYLTSSNAFAGQAEGKWAVNEGFAYVPDIAIRGAYTRLFNVKFWNLSTADLDLMISKRWALKGVTSLTPYLVARYTWIWASSEQLDFAPALGATDTQGSFPKFDAGLYRTTLGLRFTASSVSLAAEATYFGGTTTSSREYGDVKIESAFGGAAKLGWEW